VRSRVQASDGSEPDSGWLLTRSHKREEREAEMRDAHGVVA
jgi:hypothetical protein